MNTWKSSRFIVQHLDSRQEIIKQWTRANRITINDHSTVYSSIHQSRCLSYVSLRGRRSKKRETVGVRLISSSASFISRPTQYPPPSHILPAVSVVFVIYWSVMVVASYLQLINLMANQVWSSPGTDRQTATERQFVVVVWCHFLSFILIYDRSLGDRHQPAKVAASEDQHRWQQQHYYSYGMRPSSGSALE